MILWDKSPSLKEKDIFPTERTRKRNPILNELITAIGVILAEIGIIGAKYGAIAVGMSLGKAIVTVAAFVAVIAYSVYSYTSGKKGRHGRASDSTSLDAAGQLVNTRSTSEPVPVAYGKTKVGGNWVFGGVSVDNANLLNIITTWSEGECYKIAPAVDWMPLFSGSGRNDLHPGGEPVLTGLCSCNSSCYGYTGCSCNVTCYSETCDCYNTTYGWEPCVCYSTWYSCLSCYLSCYADAPGGGGDGGDGGDGGGDGGGE